MYFGHYAVATAIKSKEEEIPTLPLLIGTGFIDIMNGLFIMVGISKVNPNIKALPYLYFDLDFIDWDHSLLMAVIWSCLFGLLSFLIYRKRNNRKKIGLISGGIAFSHFLIDIPVHNSDLALYPYSNIKIGMNMWRNLGRWAWGVEVAFTIILLIYSYINHKKRNEKIGIQIAFVSLLFIQMSPWLSPMKIIVQLDYNKAIFLHGFLVFIGFIIPGIILAQLYKRTEKKKILKELKEER